MAIRFAEEHASVAAKEIVGPHISLIVRVVPKD